MHPPASPSKPATADTAASEACNLDPEAVLTRTESQVAETERRGEALKGAAPRPADAAFENENKQDNYNETENGTPETQAQRDADAKARRKIVSFAALFT